MCISLRWPLHRTGVGLSGIKCLAYLNWCFQHFKIATWLLTCLDGDGEPTPGVKRKADTRTQRCGVKKPCHLGKNDFINIKHCLHKLVIEI